MVQSADITIGRWPMALAPLAAHANVHETTARVATGVVSEIPYFAHNPHRLNSRSPGSPAAAMPYKANPE